MKYPLYDASSLDALLESARQKHLIFAYHQKPDCIVLQLDGGAEVLSPDQAHTFLQAVLDASGSYRLN